MTSIEINATGDTARVMISWDAVCERYAARFCEQFKGKRKIHFDTLPEDMRTVDGAKTKWMLLVMLDAMIYFLTNDFPIDSARRYFHQQRELCDAIMAEISLASDYLQTLSNNNNGLLVTDLDPIHIEAGVQELSYPWDNLNSFRAFHHKSTPTKAKKKFLAIVKHLSSHSAMEKYDFDLSRITHQVLMKVMSCQGLFEDSMTERCEEDDVLSTAAELSMDEPSLTVREDNIPTITSPATPSSWQSYQRPRSCSSLTSSSITNSEATITHQFQDACAASWSSSSNSTVSLSFDSQEVKNINEKRALRKSHGNSPLLSMYKPSRSHKASTAVATMGKGKKQQSSVSLLKFHRCCPSFASQTKKNQESPSANNPTSHFMYDMLGTNSDSEDDDYLFPPVHSPIKAVVYPFNSDNEGKLKDEQLHAEDREEPSISSAMDDEPQNTKKCCSSPSDTNEQSLSEGDEERQQCTDYFHWDVLMEDLDTFSPAESMFLQDNFRENNHCVDLNSMDVDAGMVINNEVEADTSYHYMNNNETSPSMKKMTVMYTSNLNTQDTVIHRNSTVMIEERDSMYRDMMDMSKTTKTLSSHTPHISNTHYSIQTKRQYNRSYSRPSNKPPQSIANYHLISPNINNNVSGTNSHNKNNNNNNNININSNSNSNNIRKVPLSSTMTPLVCRKSQEYRPNTQQLSTASTYNCQAHELNTSQKRHGLTYLNNDGTKTVNTVIIKSARK